MKWIFVFLLALAACGERPEAFKPFAVSMPVEVPCKTPEIAPPDDAMAALAKDASLTDGMKACLQQVLLDKAYAAQADAAMKICR